MQLDKITYRENEGQDQEWILEEMTLDTRNLLVGRNATGKSRTLKAIATLAHLLRAKHIQGSVSLRYTAQFSEGTETTTYAFEAKNGEIQNESLSVDDRRLLSRGEGGVGRIFADKIDGGSEIDFQTSTRELAAVVRRDAIQHPWLRPLHDWAKGVRHYLFGTSMGRERFRIVDRVDLVADDRDPGQVVGLFQRGMKEFAEPFRQAVLRDMACVGYRLDDVETGTPVSVDALESVRGEAVGLRVKERDRNGLTDQMSMSQGMFRVLSIVVILNYLMLAKSAGCLLIDDIGEGLDFDRSCRLIDLLREKCEGVGIQLILSTNDKFVMNRVPLEEWSVLRRTGSRIEALNHRNSREAFEEFKFTGLSNFSFLEMDFIDGVPEEQALAP